MRVFLPWLSSPFPSAVFQLDCRTYRHLLLVTSKRLKCAEGCPTFASKLPQSGLDPVTHPLIDYTSIVWPCLY